MKYRQKDRHWCRRGSRAAWVLVLALGLGGCADAPAHLVSPSGMTADTAGAGLADVKGTVPGVGTRTGPGAGAPETSVIDGDSKVTQCNNELAALKYVNADSYERYRTEMNHLVASGKRYMNVQGGISDDINDLMMPRYQYGMASLCWRIRNALSQSLMKQADIPQGREL